MKSSSFLFSFALFLTFSLTTMTGIEAAAQRKLVSINIIDRNGMSETISSKERLSQFSRVNFSEPQPYQKVLRLFSRDQKGNRRSLITSYHANGEPKQSLEAMNDRANGPYVEYYSNGVKKVESLVIGGIADITPQSEQTWLFHGICKAWDEEGHLLAEILYDKGVLEGTSFYYHSNGMIWKELPYKNHLLEGLSKIYLPSGTLLQTISYKNGIQEGESARYWDEKRVAYKEMYHEGRLVSANYFSQAGESLSQIVSGNGERVIFGKDQIKELHQYKDGLQEGEVKIFDRNHHIIHTYTLKDDEKYGKEYEYYPSHQKELLQPKFMITWKEGVIQGVVQSWFQSGQLENRKEMSQNRKNGLSTCWYQNGSMMNVEEYENDLLIKGEYYRINEKEPASVVKNGQGIALLFDSEGPFIQKVVYQDGKPTL